MHSKANAFKWHRGGRIHIIGPDEGGPLTFFFLNII